MKDDTIGKGEAESKLKAKAIKEKRRARN